MASVSSSITSQPKKYDVFVSFRGSDVRNGFLSFLHKALLDAGVDIFVDENLERGEDISTSLLETIEQSYLSLVIFSENYAFSPWCLDELLKIHQCKKTMGQTVLPVFYGVDPTHVQELTGSFGAAVAKHREDESNCSFCKVESWCQALKDTAALSGLVSQNIKSDAKLIEEIINHVLEKLDDEFSSDQSCNDNVLIGIDSRVNCVESLLRPELVDVRVIGIWGMGGIGKTTIAEQVFDRIRDQFPNRCFIAGVREMTENLTVDRLQSEALSELLGTENSSTATSKLLSPFNRRRLARKKVLIVLDDVSDLKQVELLIGKSVKYGPFSRIIMTSRDKQVLKNGCAEIYEVEGLNMREALWLFRLHAFKKNTPEEGYEMLSRRAVGYAQGLPLALKVLGSNLYGKSAEEWEDELAKLQDTSNDKIQKILRISYDGLCENDKEIFLDIACFFKGKDRDYVERILGVGSKIGISRLVDKSLISISNYNKELHIHDLIEQMGKDIICEEKQLGRRSRLWHHEDICYVLTKNKGTEAIQGISLDISKIRDVQLSPKAFEEMDNLRFLKFYNGTTNIDLKAYYHFFHTAPMSSWENAHLPKGLKFLLKGLNFLSGKLRYLRWDEYPLESLPISFCAENLVELCLRGSKLKELWNGVQHLENLKVIDLSWSSFLIRIPDLSRALNLEKLYLEGCSSLVEIPSSLKYLSKLTELDLSCCSSLCSLPSCLHLHKLEKLFLSYCSKIQELPAIPCHSRTEISQVPTSFPLSELHLSGCSELRSLSDNVCTLRCLRHLDIGLCRNLPALPENLGNLSSLEKLIAKRSGIGKLPDSICNLKNLKKLDVSACVNLVALPENLGNLASLRKLNAKRTGIKYLPRLPTSLKELDVSDCASLKSASGSFDSFCRLKNCKFMNCINLGEDEPAKMMELALERPSCSKTKNQLRNSFELCVPGSAVTEKMKYKNKSGSSLSVSLSQNIRALYFCVVLDPNLFRGGRFLDRRSGRVRCEIINARTRNKSKIYSMEFERIDSSKNVLLWRVEFNSDEHLLDPTIFSFFCSISDVPVFLDAGGSGKITHCNDAIIECGVHPVFYHDDVLTDDEDMLSDDDDDDDESLDCGMLFSDDDIYSVNAFFW